MRQDDKIEKMIEENQKLVWMVINKHYPTFRDDDDIYQAGMIGLWKACKTFDPDKSKFSTYAATCIKNQIKMEFRDRSRYTRLGSVVSLEDVVNSSDSSKEDILLSETIEDTRCRDSFYEVEYDLRRLESSVSSRDYDIFIKTLEGYTAREIGEMHGISRSMISRINTKVREKFCKMFDVKRGD